jgi:uncharacterized membrane protein
MHPRNLDFIFAEPGRIFIQNQLKITFGLIPYLGDNSDVCDRSTAGMTKRYFRFIRLGLSVHLLLRMTSRLHSLHYLLCCAGVVLALYTLHVESMLLEIPGYTPACDISDWAMSCSRVFNSKYAHPMSNFGFVNRGSSLDFSLGQLALVYFGMMFTFPLVKRRVSSSGAIFRIISHGAIGFNAYLAYVLKFVLGEVCIVCVSNYLVNLALWLTISKISREITHEKTVRKDQ